MTYIKLFRKITEWEHYQDSKTLHLFLHLLLNAVHNKQYIFGIQLNRGQYFTSSRSLQKELGMCAKNVTESIQKLRDSGEITTERCMNGTIFTIVHYDDYQGSETGSKNKRNPDQPKGNGIGRTDF